MRSNCTWDCGFDVRPLKVQADRRSMLRQQYEVGILPAWRRRSVLKWLSHRTEVCAPRPDSWLSERHAHLHWKNREHIPWLGFDRNLLYLKCRTASLSRHDCPGFSPF